MSTYSRYLIAQITRPMVTTIVVALVALLAERTLRVVDLVVGWRGSLLVIFEMLGYLVPHYMGLALPVAFFLGILLTFARLSREGELAAIFASGTGLPQLLRPLLVASLVLAVVTGLLMSHIQPYARYAYRAAVAALTNASFHTLLQEGIFTTVGRTTYMMEGLSADKRELSGVFLHSRDDEGNAVTVTAERGEVNRTGAMAPVELTLANGLQQLVPAAKPRPDGDDVPSEVVLRFRAFETTIAGSGDALAPRGEDEREMTLPELWQNRGRSLGSIDAEEIEAELAGRLVRILSLPALPLMAVPWRWAGFVASAPTGSSSAWERSSSFIRCCSSARRWPITARSALFWACGCRSASSLPFRCSCSSARQPASPTPRGPPGSIGRSTAWSASAGE